MQGFVKRNSGYHGSGWQFLVAESATSVIVEARKSRVVNAGINLEKIA
jgi:hypothetical protein